MDDALIQVEINSVVSHSLKLGSYPTNCRAAFSKIANMQRVRFYALLLVTLCAIAGVVFFCASNAAYLDQINNASTQRRSSATNTARSITTPSTTTPATRNYKDTLAKLEAARLRLASRFQHASPTEKTAVLAEARTIITRSIYEDLFPAWYGTPWDFNGTSETPQ